MTSTDNNSIPPIESADDKKKLEQIIEKDAKSTRTPTGLWHAVIAVLAAAMVLFYFYTAGVASVATQYHRGVYVFITYVLVFLLYPVGKSWVRYPLLIFVGAAGLIATADRPHSQRREMSLREDPGLTALSAEIGEHPRTHDLLNRAILENPPVVLRDGAAQTMVALVESLTEERYLAMASLATPELVLTRRRTEALGLKVVTVYPDNPAKHGLATTLGSDEDLGAALRLLAKGKSLRGTFWDVFGRTSERRREREMITQYEEMLDRIAPRLSAGTHATATALAGLPLEIRGFGHVKLANADRAEARRDALLKELEAPSPVPMAAE